MNPGTGEPQECSDQAPPHPKAKDIAKHLEGDAFDVAIHEDHATIENLIVEVDLETTFTAAQPRNVGNGTVLVWTKMELRRAGRFLACWCNGQAEPLSPRAKNAQSLSVFQPTDSTFCRRRGNYQVQAVEIYVDGPYAMDGKYALPDMKTRPYETRVAIPVHLRLEGVGFRRADRVKIYKKMYSNQKCGADTYTKQDWAENMFGTAPFGPPAIMTGYSATWTDFAFLDNQVLLLLTKLYLVRFSFSGRYVAIMTYVGVCVYTGTK